jgi:hypothetical protein
MKKIVYFITAIFLITLTSCEDVIQVKLDQGAKLIVVDAFVNDMRSFQKIRVTYTGDYFSGTTPPPVKGANVVLKDITNNNSFTFADQGNGDYTFFLSNTDTIGYIGHTYQLQVTYGGSSYSSIATLKRTTQIDSISVKYNDGSGFGKEGYTCAMWAFDVPGPISDYYWIKSFRNGVLFNKGSEINVAVDGAYSNGADGYIFIPPIAEAITPGGERFNKNDVCRVEIHSISLDTYNFLLQVQTQTTNSGLFATTPENIRTNITSPDGAMKAIGWFNMSAVSAATRTIN